MSMFRRHTLDWIIHTECDYTLMGCLEKEKSSNKKRQQQQQQQKVDEWYIDMSFDCLIPNQSKQISTIEQAQINK